MNEPMDTSSEEESSVRKEGNNPSNEAMQRSNRRPPPLVRFLGMKDLYKDSTASEAQETRDQNELSDIINTRPG